MSRIVNKSLIATLVALVGATALTLLEGQALADAATASPAIVKLERVVVVGRSLGSRADAKQAPVAQLPRVVVYGRRSDAAPLQLASLGCERLSGALC